MYYLYDLHYLYYLFAANVSLIAAICWIKSPSYLHEYFFQQPSNIK